MRQMWRRDELSQYPVLANTAKQVGEHNILKKLPTQAQFISLQTCELKKTWLLFTTKVLWVIFQ